MTIEKALSEEKPGQAEDHQSLDVSSSLGRTFAAFDEVYARLARFVLGGIEAMVDRRAAARASRPRTKVNQRSAPRSRRLAKRNTRLD